MSKFAIYQVSDGHLVSTGTVVADPLPDGLMAVAIDDGPYGEWNTELHAFDAVAATVYTWPEAVQFMKEFTIEEEATIRVSAETDGMLKVFLARLAVATVVHANDQDVIDGMAYLQSKNLLTTDRVKEILHE